MAMQVPRAQSGVSLIIVMVILVIVTILGIGGAKIAMQGERSTRYDRDYLVASQATEAALMDAQLDIGNGIPANATVRSAQFVPGSDGVLFNTATCGTQPAGAATSNRGLCAAANSAAKPIWLTVDFTNVSATAPTVGFGDFTNRVFPSGSVGVQPSQAPRYIIEEVPDLTPGGSATTPNPQVLYRITAVGFGPNPNVQVAMQISYRKP